MQAELARLHDELTILTKTVARLADADERRRRHAAWVASREEDVRRLRTGPPIGLLVGGGLLMASGVALLAANDDFIPVGASILAAGSVVALTGIITLTRTARKRRAIRQDILRSWRAPGLQPVRD